ncbi:MAG: hypothetical protein HKN32_09780, partial [Flavobacteriales bacterium]|nr:hypothetical protein [Flavobacteriales bacterium]
AYDRIKSLKGKFKLADRLPVDVTKARSTVGKEINKKIAVKAAEAALIANDPKSLLPVSMETKLAVSRLAVEDVEEIIRIAEGIGPNYANAFNDFVLTLKGSGYDVLEFEAGGEVPTERLILAVGENYPLPGKSLDLHAQIQRLEQIKESNNHEQIIYIGLKDPYDLNSVKTDAYISAIGSNISNIRAVVNLLTGEAEANGELPVSPIKTKQP